MRSTWICAVMVVGCTKTVITPYEQSFGPDQPGKRRYMVTIRVHDDMEDSVIREYLFRRANELCPNGWDTTQDMEDLDVNESEGNNQKKLAMDISCK